MAFELIHPFFWPIGPLLVADSIGRSLVIPMFRLCDSLLPRLVVFKSRRSAAGPPNAGFLRPDHLLGLLGALSFLNYVSLQLTRNATCKGRGPAGPDGNNTTARRSLLII